MVLTVYLFSTSSQESKSWVLPLLTTTALLDAHHGLRSLIKYFSLFFLSVYSLFYKSSWLEIFLKIPQSQLILSQLITDTTARPVFPQQFQSPWSIIFPYLNRGSIQCCPHWCIMATMVATTRVIGVDPIIQSSVPIHAKLFLETKNQLEHKSSIWCFCKKTLFQEMLITEIPWRKYSLNTHRKIHNNEYFLQGISMYPEVHLKMCQLFAHKFGAAGLFWVVGEFCHSLYLNSSPRASVFSSQVQWRWVFQPQRSSPFLFGGWLEILLAP